MTVDITTRYLGLELANPLVPSAGPLTGTIDSLLELQEAGAAAVVLPSLFEEQIEHDAMEAHHFFEYGAEISPESSTGYLPEFDAYNAGADNYLDTLRRAKQELTIPVIASLNGQSKGGWTAYARLLEDEGADALELNVYRVAADTEKGGKEVELEYLDLVEAVRKAVSIPLAVKVSPYFSSMANMAVRLFGAGADGLVLFNRFYQPDIDLDELKVVPDLVLSNPVNMRLALRWMAILKGRVSGSLAASSGVHTGEDAVKMILAGADIVMMTSALLKYGAGHLATVLFDMESWFADRDYTSIEQAKGSLSQRSSTDPAGYERTNYMRTLVSYSSMM
jgi:dihydroorotate dehydrogenase (fumarate)